jgi:uncharacterized protein YjdB
MNFFKVNMVANYYKPGPATRSNVKRRIAEPGSNDLGGLGEWYVSDNYVVGYPVVTANNWLGIDGNEYAKLDEPWDAMPFNQQTAEEAYYYVLAHAGCSKPNRDTIDNRIIHEVRTVTSTYGNNGIITVPGDVGGWPSLTSETAPVDTDHDGMPDSWEKAHGLDTANAADRNTVGADGYTMLENYLNNLAAYTPVSVTGISFASESDTVEKTKTIQLYPVVSPYDATNQIVTWSSSDTTVATVDGSGIVRGVESGTAVVTATSKDGGYSVECTVVVFSIPVTDVSVDPAEVTLNIGRTKRIKAVFEPSDASDKRVTWESNDTSVATVTSYGYVKAISPGSATITVTTNEGNFSDTCQVEVAYPAFIQESSQSEIRVYPNPFTNKIIINYEGLDNVNRIEVLNATGQVLKILNKDVLKANFVNLTLDIPGNLFLVRINTDNYAYTRTIVRE